MSSARALGKMHCRFLGAMRIRHSGPFVVHMCLAKLFPDLGHQFWVQPRSSAPLCSHGRAFVQGGGGTSSLVLPESLPVTTLSEQTSIWWCRRTSMRDLSARQKTTFSSNWCVLILHWGNTHLLWHKVTEVSVLSLSWMGNHCEKSLLYPVS